MWLQFRVQNKLFHKHINLQNLHKIVIHLDIEEKSKIFANLNWINTFQEKKQYICVWMDTHRQIYWSKCSGKQINFISLYLCLSIKISTMAGIIWIWYHYIQGKVFNIKSKIYFLYLMKKDYYINLWKKLDQNQYLNILHV